MTFFTQLYQQVLRDPPFFEETWESKTSARNLVFLDNQFHYIQVEHSVLKSNKKVSLAIFHTVLKLEFAKFTNNQSGFLFGNETFLSDFQPWWTSILRWYYYLVSVIIFFCENTPWLRSHFTTPSWHIVGKVCPINNLETLDAQYQNWLYPLSTLTITFHISNIWKTCLKLKQTCYSAWKCFFLRSVFPRPILEIRILFQSHREKKCPIKSSSFLCPIGHGPSPF